MQKRVLFFLFVSGLLSAQSQDIFFHKASKTPNVDSAIFYAERSIQFAKKQKDTIQIIEGTCLLAHKLSIKSLYTRAEKRINECLAYPLVKKQPFYQGRLCFELALIYKYQNDYAQSLSYYLKAKSIFEKIRSWSYLVKCETHLAEYYRSLGKHKNANDYIDAALINYKKYKLADTALLITIYNRAAAIDNESNPDAFASIRNSRMALYLAKRSGNKDAEATSLNELGFTYKNHRKLDSSEFFYRKAEEIWFSIGDKAAALHAMNNRAMLYMHNNYDQAKIADLYSRMISIVTKEKIDYPLNDAYSYFSLSSLARGDSGKAYKYFYLYHKNVVSNIRQQYDIQVTNITERYESEKAKKEVKRVTGELSDSLIALERKKAQNRRMYFFIAVLIALTALIAFLLVRIKKTNLQLAERNKEKDALIQEIHHRVKNNLQFISSLINMQMNSSVDNREIHTLNDASRRIRAMALVHEMLYNAKETKGISIKQYLEELVISLDQLVNSDKIPIAFKLHLEDESFNVSDSIALGMITSELVSNSMKHGFKGTKNPEIEMVLRKEKNNVLFTIRDNGVGLKDGGEQKKTLGMRLIDIFSRQLKGNYTIAAKSGYCYEIQFTAR